MAGIAEAVFNAHDEGDVSLRSSEPSGPNSGRQPGDLTVGGNRLVRRNASRTTP